MLELMGQIAAGLGLTPASLLRKANINVVKEEEESYQVSS